MSFGDFFEESKEFSSRFMQFLRKFEKFRDKRGFDGKLAARNFRGQFIEFGLFFLFRISGKVPKIDFTASSKN